MRLLRKLGAFALLVLVAPLLAAAFGAAHDQVSYTLAPEYFTRFKFDQFAWAGVRSMPPRVGAAVVGALATWWVGRYVGILVAAAGLRHPSATLMLRGARRAFGVAAAAALVVGLLGFTVAWLAFDPSREYVDWWRPNGIEAPRRFFAAGMMHSGSYLGGALGTLAAVAQLWRRGRGSRQAGATRALSPAS